ncbi:MAG TPA: hypothetical protein VGM98_03025 [Schlesneria sp.]|jgi:hypothetical protein
MSTYDLLHAQMICPRCGTSRATEIELFVGIGNLIDYQIGDQIQWVPKAAPQNGGRPPNGDCEAEGYAECDACGKDFFVKAIVRDGKLVDVVVDASKPGYK